MQQIDDLFQRRPNDDLIKVIRPCLKQVVVRCKLTTCFKEGLMMTL